MVLSTIVILVISFPNDDPAERSAQTMVSTPEGLLHMKFLQWTGLPMLHHYQTTNGQFPTMALIHSLTEGQRPGGLWWMVVKGGDIMRPLKWVS